MPGSGFNDGPILVTGGSGQLARSLEAVADEKVRLRRIGRPELDFDVLDAIVPRLAAIAPRLIINAAAYTAVDKAETEQHAADRANHLGPKLIAQYCAAQQIPLIHVSTDYVFDGSKGAPYVETDQPNPTGVYGATKLAGEQAVLNANPQTIVLRTSWVYAAEGKNFVLTMLNAAKRMPKLRVVADQIGNPTSATDLAKVILGIAAIIQRDGCDNRYRGIYHAAGTGTTSWFGLANAVFRNAAGYGVVSPEVEAITTAEWPTPARRPQDSRLNCHKLESIFGLSFPPWEQSLSQIIETLLLPQISR